MQRVVRLGTPIAEMQNVEVLVVDVLLCDLSVHPTSTKHFLKFRRYLRHLFLIHLDVTF